MSDQAFDASLDLLRRLDPKNISSNLSNICRLQPELAEDLLSSVDTPLKTERCSISGKNYLCCDYNRDGDSYRSPWSNTYFPKIDDEGEAPYPSDHLRILEKFANDSVDIYRDLYYEGGISSVYFWDQEEGDTTTDGRIAFDGVILLKKDIDNESSWDSIHVFEIDSKNNGTAIYKLTSTIILDLSDNNNLDNNIYLSGNLTRQTIKELQYKDSTSHVANIGSLMEDVESKMRNMLQEVYFGKTKDILGDLRSIQTLEVKQEEREKQEQLIQNFERM